MAKIYTPEGKQVEVPLDYFNADCNEFLKTRKGFRCLMETYGFGWGRGNDMRVEDALRAEHLMWGWPLFD